MQTKQWNSNTLDIDEEVMAKYIGEDSQADSSIAEDEDRCKVFKLEQTPKIKVVPEDGTEIFFYCS